MNVWFERLALGVDVIERRELVLDEALDVRAGEVFVHRERSGRGRRARACADRRDGEARGEARGERRFAYTVRLTRDYNGEAARSKTLYE